MTHMVESRSRGGSRSAATSKMERFVIIVNGWKLLTIITKRSILDVAANLGPPLRRSSCLHHNDALHTEIDMWLSPKVKLLEITIDEKITFTNHINTLCSNILSAFTRNRKLSFQEQGKHLPENCLI